MSDPPTPNFYEPPPPDEFAPPADNAPQLIRLAVIFNYISVGLDASLALLGLGLGGLLAIAPEMAPRKADDPPVWLIALFYACVGVFAAIIAIIKAIATRKLQTGRRGAWGWGLAAGIIGCAQLFCASCCCLQVAAGVYTVVILCFENVRSLLASTQTPDPPLFSS